MNQVVVFKRDFRKDCVKGIPSVQMWPQNVSIFGTTLYKLRYHAIPYCSLQICVVSGRRRG